ncbi:MAG: DNA recombination protein RmuC [Bacteroidetes bacterium ADurb.Bin174]|nr:MAG: DNA recombination protein RmuC [Bacteroidetes bacterium ADurb.Bin174]
MNIILVIIGIAAGLIIGYLLAKNLVSHTILVEKNNYADLDKEFAALKARTENEIVNLEKQLDEKQNELDAFLEKMDAKDKLLREQNVKTTEKEAEVKALQEKLATLKEEVDKIGEKYAAEFKNLANEILEDKSQRFTQRNKENLEALLKPLDENIKEFKKTVTEVYDKESKERFSLGNEVKKLADLNQLMSEEARNLTKALKGDSKTQGDWGEMILESILEKSGLRKDEEYFIQEELKDEEGKSLRSSSENKKMRPDAVVMYPDNRTVIIDSKVSLNAFTRYIDAPDPETQQKELDAHVAAIKNHIITLSTKGYDDYDKSLDFVMMFIPSEPAYIAAMQGDKDLWSFAYDKRILLMNPTNLITSLKLISDLWKREYQNRNALAIAERGALLYDKFAGFIDNMKDIGKKLEQATESYTAAFGQLATGRGNLMRQAEELRELGIKPKKSLAIGDFKEEN